MTMKRQKTLHRFAAVAAVLLTLCLVFMMPAAADATETTVVVSEWASLTTAFTGNNAAVTLENDVSSQDSQIQKITINDGNTYTLDLNGHTMKGLFSGTGATGFIEITGGSKLTIKNGTVEAINKVIHVNGGELTLGDGITSLVLNATDGTTDVQNQVINIYGSSDSSQTDYSVVTINAGVTINGLTKDKTTNEEKGYGIIIRENTTNTNVAYGVKLTLNGDNYINADASGIWVLGNIKYARITDGDTLSKAPTIVIENTVIHAGTTAIAAMGYANWNINGGIFNAEDALNIKAGNFTITEGSFQADGNYNVPTDANGNGTENTGSAVSILSNDGYRTEKDISVVIKGGIFLSQNGHVLYEGIGIWDSDSSSHEKGGPASTDSHVKTLSISGGTFTSHVNEYDRTTVNLTSFQSESVVTGGTFKSVRSENMVLGTEYLVSGYALAKDTVTENSQTYYVGTVEKEVVTPLYALTLNTTSINLGNVPVNSGTTSEYYKVLNITNTGTESITLSYWEEDSRIEHFFTRSDDSGSLSPGKSCDVKIYANTSLPVGEYTTTVSVGDHNGASGLAQFTLTYTLVADEPGTSDVEEVDITVAPTSINLGKVVIGSDTYEEVTITNNGVSTISLKIWEDIDDIDDVPKFGVGGGEAWSSIDSGKTVTLKIYANESLPVGTYSTEMKIGSNDFKVFATVPITYTLVESTSQSPDDVPSVERTPNFNDVIDAEDKKVTITVDRETTDIKGNVVTVMDKNSGVTMTMTFTSAPTSGNGGDTITGTVAKVEVKYEDKPAGVNQEMESSGTVNYSMVIDLTKADIKLPTLNSTFDSKQADNIKKVFGHTLLAMITATHTDDVNDDMRGNFGDQVTFTFKISKSLLDGKSMNRLVGYHIAEDGKVTKIVPNSGDRYEKDGYIYVTIKGDKFSTYAVGISDKEEVITPSGGSSGSGSGSGLGSGSGSGSSGSSGSSTVTPVVPPTEEPTDDPTDVPDEPELPETPGTPEQPETPATPAPLFAVLAGLGAAVIMRRK